MTRFWDGQTDRRTDGQTDGQTDGVTALLDLLSPSATQVKIYMLRQRTKNRVRVRVKNVACAECHKCKFKIAIISCLVSVERYFQVL